MRPMTRWIGVLGTWGAYRSNRWDLESPLTRFLERQGFAPARPGRPFNGWTTNLDGVPVLANGNDWEAGAEAVTYYAESLPYESLNFIVHSHAGQCLLIAAANGLKVRSLVMVGTPVRKDIELSVAPAAVTNIGRCLHITDARWDVMGFAGAVFDGRWSLRRTFRVPGIESVQARGIGHSGLLTDPSTFHLWVARGWLDVLRGEAALV